MPRVGVLRELAREHHGSLLLARDIARFPEPATPEALALMNARIASYWQDELAAHFRREEALLVRHPGVLPEARAMRLLDEHRVLAAMCLRADSNDLGREALARFGRLLHDHVRFEERECFDALQAAETAA